MSAPRGPEAPSGKGGASASGQASARARRRAATGFDPAYFQGDGGAPLFGFDPHSAAALRVALAVAAAPAVLAFMLGLLALFVFLVAPGSGAAPMSEAASLAWTVLVAFWPVTLLGAPPLILLLWRGGFASVLSYMTAGLALGALFAVVETIGSHMAFGQKSPTGMAGLDMWLLFLGCGVALMLIIRGLCGVRTG